MNEKNIKNNLTKKHNDWLASIPDAALVKDLKENTFITGGAIASLLLGEEPHDYDIYCLNKATAKKIALYYTELFNKSIESGGEKFKNRYGFKTRAFVLDGETRDTDIKANEGWDWKSSMLQVEPDRIKIIIRSDGVASETQEEEEESVDYQSLVEDADEIESSELEKKEEKSKDKKNKEPYRVVFLSPNAITLSNGIQIVIRFFGEPDKIHENYDYIHCTNFWLPHLSHATVEQSYEKNGFLSLNEKALVSLMNKELIYMGSKYPIASIIRLRKFLKRGWYINAGQILKMSFQISNLDLRDPIVLEDQLVGVDTLYFKDLVFTLEYDRKNNDSFEFTNEYFISVVDKVFG